MYNTNDITGCREFPDTSQQREISQTERLHLKNAVDAWMHICVWAYIFYHEASQI